MKLRTTQPGVDSRRAGRSLSALLAAHAISQTGNVVTTFAVPFYVLGTGGTGVQVGIAAFCATAPIVIGGALGGVVVDRAGHRRVAIVADLASGAFVLLIPLLALTLGLPFWTLLLLVFAAGLLDTPGQTARRVMLPNLSARAGIRLEQSVGLLDGSERLARLVGAAVAGLLVASFGPIAALFVNATTFAVSAVVTGLLVPGAAAHNHPGDSVGAAPGPSSYWSDLRAGLHFIVQDPLMRLIVALVLVTNLLDAARSSTLMPLYAEDRLDGAAALGILVAAMGGCALLGNVMFGFVAHRFPRRITFAVCFVLAGGPSAAAFAFGAPLDVLLATTALSGFAAGAINPILGAVQLERVPEKMRGRVFGMINAGAWAGVPFGALLGGVAADTIGLSWAFGVVAVVYTVITLTPLLGGSWTMMEHDDAVRPTQDAPDAPGEEPA
ncbi:MFS transporter [Nesterenkonia sp. Act20]|uniref:MFS transporter n=1 Tax=Nesterenkonia sp. Act20 TaxID=1483432 RepID=UPI001C47F72D|nr:MFS transporter [Nesterenkonia sp. Act20]